MQLTFLTGPVPLTKTITYNKRLDAYTTAPYPMVQRVTSSTRDVSTLHEFAQALIEEGRRGACLLKGALDAKLVGESRAGHVHEHDHEWVCFDFDAVDCVPGRDGAAAAIAKYLPEGVRGADLLVQLSASAYRPDCRRFSGHLFALLDRPVPTRTLHGWFTELNFSNRALRSEIRLTESTMGLHFPLDRTVSSSSKLLYIAPPRCVGFKPTVQDPVFLLSGRTRTITVPTSAGVAHEEELALLNQLRDAAGISKRSFEMRGYRHGMEVLVDAEQAQVSDIRASGEGYIRFNLNGGDSHAYFIDLKHPHVIHNFKGEPLMLTEEVTPDLHKALLKNAKSVPPMLPSCAVEPLAFYATNRQSTIYIGSYDREKDTLRLDSSTIQAAYSFLASYGVPLKPSLPHYDLVTDMTSEIRFEEGYPVINLYRQTDYLKHFASLDRTVPCDRTSMLRLKQEAPLWWRIIDSVVGSEEVAAVYFINWLAAVFQRRQRVCSAWVMTGCQGTGKGLLVEHLLQPLFGEEMVTQQIYSILKSNHNSFLEGKLIVVFNEADMSAVPNWSEVRSKLYDWITEPKVCINPKGKDERNVPNNVNMLFMSNKTRPVIVEDDDRRFNVGEFQRERLFVSANDIAALINQEELPAVAKLLGEWQINDEMLIKPYAGKTKENIYEATHNLVDRIARAIHEGDTAFFVDNRPDDAQLRTDFSGKILPIREFDVLLENMVEGRLNVLTVSDLYVMFRMVAVSEKMFPEAKAAQRQIYQRHNLLPDKDRTYKDKRSGLTVRGVPSPVWATSEGLRAMIKKTDDTNVVPLVRS